MAKSSSHAKAVVADSESSFRLLVESVLDYAIFMLDPNGNVTTWNKGAQRLKGYARDEIVGKHFSIFYPPESLASGLPQHELVTAAQVGRYEDEGWRLRKDGTRFWANVVITALYDATGALAGFAKVTRDLTERRMAEQALRKSKDDLEITVGVRTSQLESEQQRFRLLWEAAAILLGSHDPIAMLRPLFEDISRHLHVDVYLNYLVDEAGRAFELVSAFGVPEESTREMRRFTFDDGGSDSGAPMPTSAAFDAAQQRLVRDMGLRAHIALPLNPDGHPLGVLIFASRSRGRFENDDIEFLQTISRYLCVAYVRLQLIDKLRESDERKTRFLAMLAHELRNPLAPVRNALHVLRAPDANLADHRNARDMMDRQVQHLARLVDDLLDVSRIMQDRIELRRERTNAALLIERATETALPLINEHRHRLSIAAPTHGLELEVDVVRITQAIGNLLINAAKYTEPGGHISLSAERSGTDVVIRVTDTGMGIAPDLLPRIFDLFTQADQPLDRSHGGLGIGLTLVRRMVELHGGTVEARSAGVGRGSEFTIRLPAAVTAEPRTTVREDAADREAARTRRRVLVVDDNADAAESSALLLRLAGHDVETAYDGLSAIERIETFRPEIALLDIGLPGLDGYEVARRVRSTPAGQQILLVAITGYGQAQDKQKSASAGFNHHLTKPVDPDVLQALVAAPDSFQLRKR